MTEKLRQTIIAFIWPGPIAGPLPVNLFRILAPLLVFYGGIVLAILGMGVLTGVTSLIFFRLLELTSGKTFVERLLRKLPSWAHKNIERQGPVALFFSSIILGVFTYAIFLRLLRYSEGRSEILLVAASLVSAIIWTGVFWGSIVEILKRSVEIAF
ncbi:MAG: hypothetical protein WD187_03630 [Candidatus Woykebacteria bacterium]